MSDLSFFDDEERKLRFIKRRARAKFRRQYRHHGLEMEGDDYEAVIANKFNFGIELKSQDQPVDGVEDQVRMIVVVVVVVIVVVVVVVLPAACC